MMSRAATAPKYKEGDLFAIPLPDGGYAIGIIARVSRQRNKGILLGYFFGSRRTTIPSIQELASVTAKDALYVCRFGDLGLLEGTWPVIGRLPGWTKLAWPMPVFAREQLVSGITLKVVYADDDPARVVSEIKIGSAAVADCPQDGLMGAQAVVQVLNSKLPTLH